MSLNGLTFFKTRLNRFIRLSLVLFFAISCTKTFGQWSDLKKAPVENYRTLLNVRWIDSAFFSAHTNKRIVFSENGIDITRSIDMGGSVYHFQMLTKTKGIAIVGFQQKKPLLITHDGGFTWDTLIVCDGPDTLSHLVFKNALHFQDSLHGFVFADSANGYTNTWVTQDGGNTWTHLDSLSSPKYSFHMLPNSASSGDPKIASFGSTSIMNAAYPPKVVFKTRNYFTKWEEIEIPAHLSFYGGLACIDSLIWLGNADIGSDTAKLITYNGGSSWKYLYYPGGIIGSMQFVPGLGSERGFLISGYQGSYVSLDTGKSWHKIDNYFHKDFRFLNSRFGISVVSVTSDSLAFRLFEGFGTFIGTKEINSKEWLIYPNPSDNQINISDATSLMAVSIFNMLGNLVFKHQVHGSSVSGIYTISYDLPPGNYVIHLKLQDGGYYALRHVEY